VGPKIAIPVVRPHLGDEERQAVARVLESGQLAQGELVEAFEQRFAAFCHVREAVAVSSGTAALHLALLAHGIGPGDEVITTPFSFAATANAVRLAGATPVFVDIEPDTYNLDPALVEAAVTARTRALLPVHLYGQPADMIALGAIAARHGLILIEDACQAHAAAIEGRPVGSFGTGCFSFYATKNMTTGEGGIITTDDPGVASRVRLLRSHGQSARYHHESLGYNLRLTEIQAALGLAQLARLEQLTARRIANAAYLTAHLDERLIKPVVRPGYRHVYHQYTVRVLSNRDTVARTLAECGIGTAVHYPCPIHLQPAYAEWSRAVSLPQAEAAAREVLSLPVHPALSAADLETIVREVNDVCQ
jgi:perosamine synthetase